MKNIFPDGVWPVMLTPFTKENKVDYKALEQLVHWYFEQGCDGLFAVCQSSEMFYLSLEERVNIASFIKKVAGGKPVIASGHISEKMEDQINELKCMEETGVDALILISNRLVSKDEGDDQLLSRLETLMGALSETTPLGFYECPYPNKVILTPKVTKYCVDTGRFHFLKDTSCNMDSMNEKLNILKGSEMKLYNANTATLLDSLRAGAAGYSGVMANFHPALYHWLCKNYQKHEKEAEQLANVLTMCSLIENSSYPVNAKYAMQCMKLPFDLMTRKLDASNLTVAQRSEVEQLLSLTENISKKLDVLNNEM